MVVLVVVPVPPEMLFRIANLPVGLRVRLTIEAPVLLLKPKRVVEGFETVGRLTMYTHAWAYSSE
jgi:hypothetical protein